MAHGLIFYLLYRFLERNNSFLCNSIHRKAFANTSDKHCKVLLVNGIILKGREVLLYLSLLPCSIHVTSKTTGRGERNEKRRKGLAVVLLEQLVCAFDFLAASVSFG